MKILVTHPKTTSAIGRLCLLNAKYMPYHEVRFAEIHPKRPDPKAVDQFVKDYAWCDVWDCQYWKSGETLRQLLGDAFFTKPSILTHHNPYDLSKSDWASYSKVVAMNKTQQKVLKGSVHIPHAVDLDLFKWNDDYSEEKRVMMVAQRIEGKKGILEVARATKELGYRFVLVGEISDSEYFGKIMAEASGSIEFHEAISDDLLITLYQSASIHVCNSVDNFESGTLPILESMASGVPVLTRPVGFVPDVFNEKNMVVRDGQPEDYEELRDLLKILMEDRPRRLAMREDAWHTVRSFEAERRAWSYSDLYYQLGYKNPLVSVVMPVFGRADELQKTIAAFDEQSYPAIEIVIVSDGDPAFDQLELKSKHTLKYARVGTEEVYGLGHARNYGVLESAGPIIVFSDQRFRPDPKMVEEFVKSLKPKMWLHGNKGPKRNFVENVSCIYRQDFIDMGMCNSLMDGYGGMTQELRERSRRQGIKHQFVEKAIAIPEFASHNYNKRKNEIRTMKNRLWRMNFS